MKIRFKKLKKSELECLQILHQEAFPGEFVRDFSDDVCWLALDERDREVGFCSLRVLKGEVFFSRSASFVSGAGVHRKSIYHRLKWMKRNGHKYAVTYVSKENYKSMVNLIRCGFRFYEPAEYWVGRSYFYLQREA